MMQKRAYFLTALFFFALNSNGAIEVRNFASEQQEKDYQSLTQELRCPQCQNNNIADSNATIAVDMREKVYELLQQGQSKSQIVDYMVQRYGNFVTYNPPLTPATLFLWAMPIGLILLGIILVLRRKPKMQEKPNVWEQSAVQNNDENLTQAEQQRLAQLLKDKE
ncbi:cytochrome c-type biogenesis protein CcmH [Avibacterium paragallinarum]|uniref:Cytochrome c-type biogenesis protein n=2 Tax=Avibacterium paragallinarum TaxID=728 RepID=A0AAE5WH34_AVIPA|nr:cytochrome c-type biogenesis protein CcmH [Avibacterium paragallinarum]PXZ41758.1 cytochrome c-type biogenesis protein CcmH [Avibacterium paragallinarum]